MVFGPAIATMREVPFDFSQGRLFGRTKVPQDDGIDIERRCKVKSRCCDE
jgi:hypothetical protein